MQGRLPAKKTAIYVEDLYQVIACLLLARPAYDIDEVITRFSKKVALNYKVTIMKSDEFWNSVVSTIPSRGNYILNYI